MKVTVCALALALLPTCVNAQTMPTFKAGVLNDQSGLYADIDGPGAVLAAKMAVEDFNPEKKGFKVEVLAADHLNKPDVGVNITRKWFDIDKVDAVVDVPTSSVALAIS